MAAVLLYLLKMINSFHKVGSTGTETHSHSVLKEIKVRLKAFILKFQSGIKLYNLTAPTRERINML